MLVSKIKQSTKKKVLAFHKPLNLIHSTSRNTTEPTFCIITPIFDGALDSLKILIKDLQNQTHQSFIHIVISNGPSNKVKKFILNLHKTDPRFIYVEHKYTPTKDYISLMKNSGVRRDYCLQNFNAKRYIFLDADVGIIDKEYFSKLHFADVIFRKDIIVTNVDYHGTILPIHPATEEGQISIANYSFSKKIAKKYRYPTDYDVIKKKQGNDYRYWMKITRNESVLFLDFLSCKEGYTRTYKRMTDQKLEETLGKEMISVFGNEFFDYDVEGVKEVLDSHIVGFGAKVTEFETRFKNHIGFKYAVGTNSCTNAFWLLFRALNLSKTDEVIIPSIYFFGVENVLKMLNVKYKIVDVDQGTPNVSLESLKMAITKKTKVILFLEYGGYPLDIKKIKRYFKEQGRSDILLILDAANSPFTKLNNSYTARDYHFALYSFDMNKILVAGEGGMILTNNKVIAEKCRSLSYYGILETKKSSFSKSKEGGEWWRVGRIDPSIKLAMNNISASLAFTQLVQIEGNLERRKIAKDLYIEKLKKLIDDGYVSIPEQDPKTENDVYLFWIILKNKATRDELANYLLKKKVYSTVKYEPIGTKKATPKAWKFFETSLCIPLNQRINHVYVDYIVSQMLGFFYEG